MAIESHTSDEKVKRLLWLKYWPFHFLLLKHIILKVSSQLVVLPSKILLFFLRLRVRLGLLKQLIDAENPRPKQLWSHGEDKSYFTTSEDILLLNALLWCKMCICHI